MRKRWKEEEEKIMNRGGSGVEGSGALTRRRVEGREGEE